jgi:HK97 gp10 family phage protein
MAKPMVEITGFPELERKIKALSDDKSKKREVVGILKQVASSTVKAAKQTAPISKKKHTARGRVIQPGNLKKSIGTIVGRKGSAKDNPTVYVGPRAKGKQDGWYGHFVEYGFNVYNKGFKRKRKAGANNGAAIRRTKGNPFMKNAYEQTKGAVTQESEAKVARYIQKRIDKLSR